MRRGILILAVLSAVLPLAIPAPAPAAGTPIVAGPGGWLTTYATPVAVTQPGGVVVIVNADVMWHDVISNATGPDTQPWCGGFPAGACPLFWSDRALTGETQPVQGLENAVPGQAYSFYCGPHPGMKGTLVVLPA